MKPTYPRDLLLKHHCKFFCGICSKPETHYFVMNGVELRVCTACITQFGNNPHYNLIIKHQT